MLIDISKAYDRVGITNGAFINEKDLLRETIFSAFVYVSDLLREGLLSPFLKVFIDSL